MARKASDLLDVFRLRPESSGSSSSSKRTPDRKPDRKPKKTKPKAKKKPRARSAGDVVLSLSRRQMMYAGCVGVLLMALSFTLGVSLAGDDSSAAHPLRRETAPTFYIVGELPLEAVLADRRVDIQAAARKLREQSGVARDKIHLSRRGDRYRIWIGPFESKRAAFEYHESYQLDSFDYLGLVPLSPGEITDESPPPGS